MHALLSLFVALLTLRLFVELYLSWRQICFVRAKAHDVPLAFAAQISAADHERAALYTVAKTKFGMLLDAAEAMLLLGWTIAGGLDWVLSTTAKWTSSALARGAVFLLMVTLLDSTLHLPASAYATFGLEARFGFNRTTVATFVLDRIKATVLLIMLGLPLTLVVLWLMEKMGRNWWVYVWVVWTGFSLVLTWIYPTVIAPLFNKFRALDSPTLLMRIEKLMKSVGFRSRSVKVMDGSKRSAHGNAYFTGFGRSKRIVFFDTLLTHLEDQEVEAVLAHELGHFKLKHVQQGLILGAIGSLAGLAVLGWLAGQDWFYLALGVTHRSMAAALALFMMTSPVFLFPIAPLMAWWSRRHEFAADRFAARHADAQALKRALVKLHRDNASTLTPDPWHSAFYDSHPPIPKRIEALALTNAFRLAAIFR
jgi:STE24 endopeptidase